MSSPAFTVLGRAPEPGRVKTRLAASIGDEAAAQVHEALALDTLARLASWRSARGASPEGLVLALCGDPAAGERLAGPARERFGARVERQGDGDLGARMEEAFARRAAEGTPLSLVFGTDAPLLPDELLDEAVGALAGGAGAVLAPSTDGGFVLMGVPGRLPRSLLSGLPWGTGEALAATEAALRSHGIEPSRVREASDVDEREDLERLAQRLRDEPGLAPATAAWLAGESGPEAHPL